MGLAYTAKLSLPKIALLDPPRAQAILRREVGTEVHAIVEARATIARQEANVGATGIMRASIGTRVELGQDATSLVRGSLFTGAQAPYAPYFAYGTRAGVWRPIAPLKLWALRVLGDERAAYRVRWAIFRRGTRPHPRFAAAFAAFTASEVGPRLRGAVARAARLLMAKG